MKRRCLDLFLAVLILGALLAPNASDGNSARKALPPEVYATFSDLPSLAQYVPSPLLKPAYLRADFNGDRAPDIAVFVTQKQTGKAGIVILDGRSKTPAILGAGVNFGNGGDDFAWIDKWRIYRKKAVAQGASDDAPPVLVGDGILVIKTMSASALIYWDGKGYAWYQQGD